MEHGRKWLLLPLSRACLGSSSLCLSLPTIPPEHLNSAVSVWVCFVFRNVLPELRCRSSWQLLDYMEDKHKYGCGPPLSFVPDQALFWARKNVARYGTNNKKRVYLHVTYRSWIQRAAATWRALWTAMDAGCRPRLVQSKKRIRLLYSLLAFRKNRSIGQA